MLGWVRIVARRRVELLCPECAGNRLSLPKNDNEPVACEDCRVVAGTLKDAKAMVEGKASGWPSLGTSNPARASARMERHKTEIAASQASIRASIAETDRLVVESEEMLSRHQRERDDEV